MKNLIFLLLSCIQFAALSQHIPVSGTVNLSNYYTRPQIDSLFKTKTVDPPIVRIPVCKRGPAIESISKITNTSAVLRFDAESVFVIKYWISILPKGQPVYLDSLRPESNTVTFNFPGRPAGSYYLNITGKSCRSDTASRSFTIDSGTGGPILPPLPVQNGKSKVLGANTARVGQREYSFNRTPELVIKFNDDGTISDITEGIDNSGGITRLAGYNVFYMIGNGWFENAEGTYEKLQNIKLPDGVRTIKQFVCNPARIPNYETFKQHLNSYGEAGVNMLNGRMSQIMVSIHSDQKVGQGLEPKWLVVSRALNFPSALPAIDWRPYNKWIATAGINKGDDQDTYRRVGVIPDARFGDPNQAMTFNTVKVEQNRVLTRDEAYSIGRAFANYMGSSPYSYITEELIENGQGQYDKTDPSTGAEITAPGYEITRMFAKGNLDEIRTKYPNIDKRNTGINGGYGGDDYHSLIDQWLLYGDRQTYEQSLTDKLYKGHSIHGFTAEDHPYYARGHIDVRNVNAKYYFWNRIYNLPYEFIALNERVKLASKTYEGKDRESNLTIFSCPFIESFISDDRGNKINIEQASSGELIEYPSGTLLTKMNTQPAAAWDEAFTGGFWSTLVTSGMAMWDAPRSTFGTDSTKAHVWSDQTFLWKKKGANDFQRYEPGKDGAPENSSDGLKHSLYAPVIDAMAAGMEAAWQIRDRTTKLSFSSYSSTRGDFIAKPGSAGLHLNGFGVPNYNSFVVKDAFDQKRAICLIGEGPGGAIIIYYNGFLSAHLFEDNVTVHYKGAAYNIGRVYGRQTVVKKL
ncbi:hypothetical protein DYBT9623_04424 [Dyadobacter sp. CECT 9623]|uniref:Uncharacterized protein n=1 Tax=Dyadobacter linearis TaxID=2823330 RepID=A0ABN7RHQ5_9BACT|nr:hypothetical protein [Dyadobacter sp. CECT 9623]CAG5072885.1 hypothetical protein DYBT9623_04424 [Dyadobacter sp. CECT 9623]